MPLIQIFTCPTCEAVRRVEMGATPPVCCHAPMRWRQTREFKPELHGWSTGQRAPHVGFRNTSPWEIPVQDASGQQIKAESLRDIRRLEKESEKMAADGEGQEMRFRAFNNDTVNGGMLRNSFGEPPQRAPKLVDAKGRQRISFETVDGEPVETMGPGADEALASALPDSPEV